jgi:hypothetical protein
VKLSSYEKHPKTHIFSRKKIYSRSLFLSESNELCTKPNAVAPDRILDSVSRCICALSSIAAVYLELLPCEKQANTSFPGQNGFWGEKRQMRFCA